jgi:hypothetical protein
MIVISQTDPNATLLHKALGIDDMGKIQSMLQRIQRTVYWSKLGFSQEEQLGALMLSEGRVITAVNALWLIKRGVEKVSVKEYLATYFLLMILVENMKSQNKFKQKIIDGIKEWQVFSRIKNPEDLKDYTFKP